jgi:hypothetical protein
MKSITNTTRQIDLYDDSPQKRPIIQQLLKFVSALKTGHTPVQNQPDTNKEIFRPAIGQKDEFVLNADTLQATAGLARSIVFFNWRDYA